MRATIGSSSNRESFDRIFSLQESWNFENWILEILYLTIKNNSLGYFCNRSQSVVWLVCFDWWSWESMSWGGLKKVLYNVRHLTSSNRRILRCTKFSPYLTYIYWIGILPLSHLPSHIHWIHRFRCNLHFLLSSRDGGALRLLDGNGML